MALCAEPLDWTVRLNAMVYCKSLRRISRNTRPSRIARVSPFTAIAHR